MKKFIKAAIVIMIFSKTYGQNDSLVNSDLQDQRVGKDAFTIVMPAGKQYTASGWKMFWWGKHYRKEWATPVPFHILKISTIDGGLEPIKVGGGHETKS